MSESPRPFELLVFDWDGTLMDSAAAIVAAIQAASRDLDLPAPDEQRARHVIGLGLSDAVSYLFPELPASGHEAVASRYRHHYFASDHEIPLFDGITEMMDELAAAGFLLAVATGKGRRGLDRALAVSRLASSFHATRCADEAFSKPHPAMLLEIMSDLGVEPAHTLMVGDTTHDLDMARNARVASLAVTYGAHPHEALSACAPLACVESVPALRAWFAART
ncbi:MAG: HAD-IA family hydrolase [Betaproteobacteria bacterium]|nr:HAD-IA family hydrolase [Betaproteobacteria bacterium]